MAWNRTPKDDNRVPPMQPVPPPEPYKRLPPPEPQDDKK